MRDAIGGLFSLQAIVIFMIVVNCFLAFSVNYTKAFRAKNEIRSIIEKYEGLTCPAIYKIEETLNKNKYHISEGYVKACTGDWKVARGENNTPLFCYKEEKVDRTGSSREGELYKGSYYTVATFVNIDVPIFNKVFEGIANVFMVRGETALIYSSGGNSTIATGCIRNE